MNIFIDVQMRKLQQWGFQLEELQSNHQVHIRWFASFPKHWRMSLAKLDYPWQINPQYRPKLFLQEHKHCVHNLLIHLRLWLLKKHFIWEPVIEVVWFCHLTWIDLVFPWFLTMRSPQVIQIKYSTTSWFAIDWSEINNKTYFIRKCKTSIIRAFTVTTFVFNWPTSLVQETILFNEFSRFTTYLEK